MQFADMVLASELVARLDERHVGIILDALEGGCVQFDADDREVIAAFLRAVRHEFGVSPAASEVEMVLSMPTYSFRRSYSTVSLPPVPDRCRLAGGGCVLE